MSDHCNSPKEKLVMLGARSASAHWRSPETRGAPPVARGEFPGGLPPPATSPATRTVAAPRPATSAHRTNGASSAPLSPAGGEGETRRDFLAMMGFGLTTAALAACRAPEQRAIPLPVASEDLVPGVANHYATTCGGCAAACALVVKQRDGRPIKIEGNDESELFGGATCATGQATVLSLYDHERLHGPLWKGEPTTWRLLDDEIAAALDEARAGGGGVALLSTTVHGPSTLALIERCQRELPGFRHVVYEPVSASALRQASRVAFGRALLPHYTFDRANTIVSLDADFLGTWISPVEFARQYGRGRSPDRGRHLHVQFEAGLSVTGSNADRRVPVRPSELASVAAGLLARVARLAGHELPDEPPAPEASGVDGRVLDEVAGELWEQRGLSLVVSGGNDLAVDRAVLAINALLGNLGCTLHVDRPSQQRQGDDEAVAELVAAMERGEIHTLILHGVNPLYDHPEPERFAAALSKVRCSISTADRRDETSAAVSAVCPDHHFLEAWGDAEPVAGHLSLCQPVIAPLYETRAFAESLLRWLGEPTSHYQYVRDFWCTRMHARQDARLEAPVNAISDPDRFWEATLERGVMQLAPPDAGDRDEQVPYLDDWREAWRALADQCQAATPAIPATPSSGAASFELDVFESVPMRDGRHANNPWLLELPDPITKVTWGNVAMLAPSVARQLGLRGGDVIELAAPAGQRLKVPVFLQPGQHPATISVALGYGRRRVGKAGNGVGVNAFALAPLAASAPGSHSQRRRWLTGVRVTTTGEHEALASTQEHFSMEGRPIVLEVAHAELGQRRQEAQEAMPTLWPERPHGERSWGMTIDLDSCTGCSACVIACQAENNVPVIGKDQVQRQRIMHWIRIDRYYAGSEENPQSVHQPMMCQHCGNAPCETVCPVLATTTSSEGLNQQTYNRCIGTRYCANNCPYKVRRFNWFNYTDNPRFDFTMANPVSRLVLNPDVTVRSRGVMEKCSLCVQRIHAGKNAAVKAERALADGDIETACQQACPTDAIVFGDLADPRSRVARRMDDERTYRVLDELGTRPNVAYLKKVRHGHIT